MSHADVLLGYTQNEHFDWPDSLVPNVAYVCSNELADSWGIRGSVETQFNLKRTLPDVVGQRGWANCGRSHLHTRLATWARTYTSADKVDKQICLWNKIHCCSYK